MISGSNEQLQQELEYTLLKPDCHSWWISKMQSGREERYAIKFCFKLGKNAMQWKLDLLLWPRNQETEFQTQEGQTEQIHPQTLDDPFFFFFFDSTGMIYMNWVPTGQTVNKEYLYVEVLREFRKPSLSQTIWPRWTSRQFLSLPLAPCDFGLFPKLTGCHYERWKRLWRRSLIRSHKRTSMGPSKSCWNGTTSALLLEEIASKGTRVSCVYYQ